MTGHLYRRDARRLRRLCEDTLTQLDFYEANGDGDEIRFGYFVVNADRMGLVARRAYRRLHRERGWTWA
ncbi:MAG: hypothetical protein NUW01_13040 [Gemmatimonadaceae bacterium]|nr:hypothetical protein [Gemmatimonadaceae bacterium]